MVGAVLVAACAQEPIATSTGAADTTPAETTAVESTAPAEPTTTAAPKTTTSTVAETTTLPALRSLAYETVAEGLPFPIFLTARPGDAHPTLATKDGRLWRLEGSEPVPLLDISDRVVNQGEQGLLGLALDPDDPTSVWVHYSATDGDTVVSELTAGADGVIDPASEREVLRLDQPAGNHNGGMLQFGPDGDLYLGLGDGGGGGDQYGNGQNDDTLLAGLVRIDPGSGEATKYAKGLRNPWRFWIDGDLVYIADVGQNSYEEVNVAPLEPGLNYGWPITEGLRCFDPRQDCDPVGLLLPVVEVEHGDAGTCSITGGIVYRGSAIPELAGHYLYSDYCGGYLRSFRFVDGAAADAADWTDQVGVPGAVPSFGVDAAGEVYVLTTEAVLRLVAVR